MAQGELSRLKYEDKKLEEVLKSFDNELGTLDNSSQTYKLELQWKTAFQDWKRIMLSCVKHTPTNSNLSTLRGNCISVSIFLVQFLQNAGLPAGLMYTYFFDKNATRHFHCASCIIHKDFSKQKIIGVTLLDLTRTKPEPIFLPVGIKVESPTSEYILIDSQNLMYFESNGKEVKRYVVDSFSTYLRPKFSGVLSCIDL